MSEIARATFGRGSLYFVIQVATALILILAANYVLTSILFST